MSLSQKILKYFLAISFVFFSSCGSQNATTSSLIALKSGNFLSECFLNRLATLSAGSNIYTISTFDITSDGSGSNTYQLYGDSSCQTALVGEGTSGTIPVQFSIVNMYDDVFILKFVQDLGGSTQTLYIAGTYVDDKYNLDIDYGANPSAGPFLEGMDTVPPSQEAVQPFINDHNLGTLFNPTTL